MKEDLVVIRIGQSHFSWSMKCCSWEGSLNLYFDLYYRCLEEHWKITQSTEVMANLSHYRRTRALSKTAK